jgi:hypothetical protein
MVMVIVVRNTIGTMTTALSLAEAGPEAGAGSGVAGTLVLVWASCPEVDSQAVPRSWRSSSETPVRSSSL